MSVLNNSSNVKVSSRVFQISKIRCRATVHPHLSDEEVGQHGALDAQGGSKVSKNIECFVNFRFNPFHFRME